MQEQPSVTRFLMLGALETLINQAIELEGLTGQRLERLHGTVVRVRCEKPVFSLYLLICEDGVDILDSYEGRVDVRIRCTLGALLHWILTAGATPEEDSIRISGPDETVLLLSEALQAFDLWSTLRRWLEEHVRVDEVARILRREDPRWLKHLESLGESVNTLAAEVGRQRLLQEEILEEVQGLKHGLRRERQLDAAFLCSGMALLLAAFATISGQLPVLWLDIQQGLQALLLASLGLTLLLSRILFGHRYS